LVGFFFSFFLFFLGPFFLPKWRNGNLFIPLLLSHS
jgi:hypothetical protein